MKTKKRKASGFFIVEILIVLAIIAILVTALLPNLSTYARRAKFADVLAVADSLRPSVELCILQNDTPGGLSNGSPVVNCANGTAGVPLDTASGYATNVSGFSSVAATSVYTFTGAGPVAGVTYIITPTYNTSGTISWTSGGTCFTQGLC